MKFPTHIILDVSRPMTLNSKTGLAWQKFYYTRFGKVNSLFIKKSFNSALKADRILVTKTQALVVSNDDLKALKKSTLAKKKIPTNRPTRYFLPYRSEFSKLKRGLARVQYLIKVNNYIASIEESKSLHRAYTKESESIHSVSADKSTTKYLFLSDQIVKDFQLEKDLFLKFTQPLLNRHANLGSSKPKTFKQWDSARLSTQAGRVSPSSILTTKQVNDKLKSKVSNTKDNAESNPINSKFCFQGYTVHLKLGKASSQFWTKKIYSKSLNYPNSSRLRALFNINFLVKEMHYSKLKYSKTAERDIVSSGSAALFAGFIGFLISEKFGIELVDSGDFYFAFMYAVFVGFSIKSFVSGLESHVTNWEGGTGSRSYTHKPAKWITLGVNSFTYFTTLVHLLLRLPYNLLHSTYAPTHFTTFEFLTSLNFSSALKVLTSYSSHLFSNISNLSFRSFDYYKR